LGFLDRGLVIVGFDRSAGLLNQVSILAVDV
jgi:hypothetical protein